MSVIEDRSLTLEPNQTVQTAWIDIDQCRIENRARMDFGSIERAGRKYLQSGDSQIWPPPNGYWDGDRFVIRDGRHEFLALLALGRTRILVAWVDGAPGSDPGSL